MLAKTANQNPLSPARGVGQGEGWFNLLLPPHPTLSPIGGEGKNHSISIS
jgi:hypothetical protein